MRQRTFSVATIDPADLDRSRRSSSDTMSLKEPSGQRSPEGSDAPPKPPRQGRRFSEPINAMRQRGLVPERLNLSKKKRPQRAELVSSDDDDGSETVEPSICWLFLTILATRSRQVHYAHPRGASRGRVRSGAHRCRNGGCSRNPTKDCGSDSSLMCRRFRMF